MGWRSLGVLGEQGGFMGNKVRIVTGETNFSTRKVRSEESRNGKGWLTTDEQENGCRKGIIYKETMKPGKEGGRATANLAFQAGREMGAPVELFAHAKRVCQSTRIGRDQTHHNWGGRKS